VTSNISEISITSIFKSVSVMHRQNPEGYNLSYKTLFYRTHKQAIERLLLQTEQFSWEDLPVRDNSGRITMVGAIPVIRKIAYSSWVLIVPHSIHMFVRGMGSEELGMKMWLPFNTRPSPLHEIIVIIQVRAHPETVHNSSTSNSSTSHCTLS
jgi:hypothetical protein